MPEKLQSLASALRTIELQLGGSIKAVSESEPRVVEMLQEHRTNLARLARELDEQARVVSAIDVTVADRMNNFLMTIQTVSDRLRDMDVDHDIRDQLRMTIDHGRATVSQIRKTLAQMI